MTVTEKLWALAAAFEILNIYIATAASANEKQRNLLALVGILASNGIVFFIWLIIIGLFQLR